jgi:dTDP-4-amino-4,6-dideoxygalactose transaminase
LNTIGNDVKVRLSKCSLSDTEITSVEKVFSSEYLGMGSQVFEFEKSISDYLKTKSEVICVNSGTSALQLSLSALGIKNGDEVLVPSLTYVASYQAISATGAIPVSCEVCPQTMFIDPKDAERRITSKTKAIMPIHYGGSSAGIEEVYNLSIKYSLNVVEDAAHSFGSSRKEFPLDFIDEIVCFSFDGIKNITTGEGGAVLTSDSVLADKLRDARLLGVIKDSDQRRENQRSWDFDVRYQGYRFHMSNINAAIGIEQLKKINIFKEARQSIASRYVNSLSNIEQITFLDFDFNEIMPHIFPIKAINRDALRSFLLSHDIETGIHYKPNHLLTLYKANINLPVTESVYELLVSLPCHAELSIIEQTYVIDKVKEFYGA